jgi:hypothetical protein
VLLNLLLPSNHRCSVRRLIDVGYSGFEETMHMGTLGVPTQRIGESFQEPRQIGPAIRTCRKSRRCGFCGRPAAHPTARNLGSQVAGTGELDDHPLHRVVSETYPTIGPLPKKPADF